MAPRLFLGAAPPAHPALGRAFDVLFLCAQEYQPTGFGRVRVFHCPIDDSRPTQAETQRIQSAAATGAALHRQGLRILCTCRQGRNRSGWLAALILVHLGLSPDKAIARIQQKRPTALSNPDFVAEIRNASRRP